MCRITKFKSKATDINYHLPNASCFMGPGEIAIYLEGTIERDKKLSGKFV